jgi:dTDP-4-dehydrorhamnose reductase
MKVGGKISNPEIIKNITKNNMANKKILIIGARGMLGQELVKVFEKDKSFTVLAWDKKEIDITKTAEATKKILALKPKIIINAAAYNAVDKCEKAEEFKLAKKINGMAPGNLAKIAQKIGAILIHYSSDYVFDGQPEIPEPKGCAHSCASCGLHQGFKPQIGFTENDKPKPINNYGKSKLLGEVNIKKNTRKFYLIRTSKLFGQSALSDEGKKSFFEVMLELGKDKNRKTVQAVDEEVSCFTYAPDLAQKTKEILEARKPFGIYHIVNSDPCTWYEATIELYRQASAKGGSAYGGKTKVIPVNSAEFPRPAQRPFYSVLLNTKLNPLRSYKEALREYLKKK